MEENQQLDELLQGWYQAAIRVMDMRRVLLTPDQPLRAYRLPANGFLFVQRGEGTVTLDDTEYSAGRFHVLHAAKGSYLDIAPSASVPALEYYLLLYKAAALALPNAKTTGHKPLQLQYGFAPAHPLSLHHKLELLEQAWAEAETLSKLRVKALFYEFVYELMRQLREQGAATTAANPVAQVRRYMHEHYGEPITLQRLAGLLGCSQRHLTRMFKSETGCSPIDYLIRLRMDKASQLLTGTDATLQEIAATVGYPDVYFFSRAFKKQTGLSPAYYKAQTLKQTVSVDPAANRRHAAAGRPHYPFAMSGYPIVAHKRNKHTVTEDNNHYQHNGEGVYVMNRRFRNSAAFLVLLSLTLLVACGGGTGTGTGNNGSGSGSTVSPSANSGATEQQAPTERVLKDGQGHEVKVPANPQRVIASYLEDHLVALGVKPVAQWSVKGGNVQEYLQGELKDVPTIAHDLPYEAVMSFQPDLIIVDSVDLVAGDKYAQYSKIAPTYTVGSEKNNDWRQELTTIGEVLNKSEQAKKALADYDAYAAQSKEKLQKAIGTQTAAALWITAKAVYVVSEKLSSGDVLYRDLGLTPPKVVQEISQTGTGNWNAISLEKLSELDAEHLFIINSRGVPKEQIINDPVWKAIPAVQKGQVYEYDQSASWLYTGTIANRQIIEDVLESIVK